MNTQLVMGNDAIALGLVEQNCRVVTAYPGTPSSEILTGVVKYKQQYSREIYTEWSANEKVAFEIAAAASWTGLRAAVAMKQVGLNVASDPLFSVAYIGVEGGLVIIAADDPGPYSSQTEQDSRLIALTAKVPVFDPSTPAEARAMIKDAFAISEKYHLPVILRPTTRLCHARQAMAVESQLAQGQLPPTVSFHKNPARWAAIPRLRNQQHIELNKKIQQITDEFNHSELNQFVNEGTTDQVGIITSGVVFHTAMQALEELGVRIPLLKVGTPYPLPEAMVCQFIQGVKNVLVLEEPDACMEMQINDRRRVSGRLDGSVPSAGELSPEIVTSVISELLYRENFRINVPAHAADIEAFIHKLNLPTRRPRMCPGCPHRSSFFAIKRHFGSSAIYPSDIGCYTLGSNLRAVDTCTNMGASVSMAQGFYEAYEIAGKRQTIVATIGDSTFLHSGIAPLLNAVHAGARFLLVILDNHVTAMTGFQPTPASSYGPDRRNGLKPIVIVDLVRACGVDFVRNVDPYDLMTFRGILSEAKNYIQSPQGGIAVVVAEHPCILYDRSPILSGKQAIRVAAECDGCGYCIEAFECPALVLRSDHSRVDVDYQVCVSCGQCVEACYKGFILPKGLYQDEMYDESALCFDKRDS